MIKFKKKKCKQCKELFQPHNSLVKVCSPDCAYKYVKAETKTREAKDLREHKKAIKSKGQWTKEAQAAFNSYIRERDYDLPCVSCQRHHTGQYHAGHYRTVGSAPELRFDEMNCWKQCSACNNHLSGNLIEYRKNLLVLIGEDDLSKIEGPHDPKKYTIEDLERIKTYYGKLARSMKKVREDNVSN